MRHIHSIALPVWSQKMSKIPLVKSKKIAEYRSVISMKKLSIILIIILASAVLSVYYLLPSLHFWKNRSEHQELQLCPIRPPKLLGPFKPDKANETLDTVNTRFTSLIELGGYSKPAECIARSRVAILIACRGDVYERHAGTLLKNLHRMLKRQQLEYQIFVLFQTPGFRFNKGALFNAGFSEVMKQRRFDCFVFHDADIIPIDDRNLYDCPRVNPRHLAAAVDKNKYELPYEDHFAGVTVFTPIQYKRMNGHSNAFWGWGGEDLDLFKRISNAGYFIERHPLIVAKYSSLEHAAPNENTGWYENVQKGPELFTTNGLNSLKYHIKEIKHRVAFTSVLVDLIPEELGRKSDDVKEEKQ